MENLWLNIKNWTKVILFSLVTVYVIIFMAENANQRLEIWFWFQKEPIKTTALELMLVTLLAGVVGTFIVRMAFRAMRQIREIRKRSSAAKLNRDVADLKAKAAMLQTKPSASASEPKPSET